MSFRWILFQCLLLLLLPHSICSFDAPFDFPIGNLTNLWTNSNFSENLHYYDDGSQMRPILLNGMGTSFVCGFYCSGNCTSFLFGVFVVFTNSGGIITMFWNSYPRVVWSANRNHPVGENATVQLTVDGDFILRDADGTLVWSTNTSGKSVLGVNMTENGNLVLFNQNNSMVWQSFDHPTDTLVLGQKLAIGQKLTANASASNWSDGGLYSLLVKSEGLVGFVESNGQQMYYDRPISGKKNGPELSHIRFVNGSLAFFIHPQPHTPDYDSISVPSGPSFQYIQLGFDGHLRLFQRSDRWVEAADLFIPFNGFGDCSFPTVCGSYGVCTNGQCSCPVETRSQVSYFRLLNDRQPSLGCSPITPLTCDDPQKHILAEIKNIFYFNLFDNPPSYPADKDLNRCKQACLSNCSCKAVLHIYIGLPSDGGQCFMLSELLSLMSNDLEYTHVNGSAYIKVQLPHTNSPSNRIAVLIGSILGVLITVIVIIISVVFKRRKGDDLLTDRPKRYTYKQLVSATNSFRDVLGKGGYGEVFKGKLDGKDIAVKSLNGENGQVESYFAEVKSIGSLNYDNVIILVGYCDDSTHRMLVYEYMANGSLENWILKEKGETPLEWKKRRSIIVGIANGLKYLHGGSNQKIWHLDIKPQNILLDLAFKAKIADFGLAEFVEKDVSEINMTKPRGTPGYLAPEWDNDPLVISEKVDVFSFGVLVLEIVCGKLNNANPDTRCTNQLLRELGEKAEKEQLFDLVKLKCGDMVLNKNEVVQMIILARACVQSDCTKRPSMSSVVNVLEGPGASLENELLVQADYSESTPLLATRPYHTMH